MKYLRTPDDHFSDLKDFDFAPHYINIDDMYGGLLRIHYLDEGPRDGEPVLVMHGELLELHAPERPEKVSVQTIFASVI